MGTPPAPQSHEATKVGKKSTLATIFLDIKPLSAACVGLFAHKHKLFSAGFQYQTNNVQFSEKWKKKRDAHSIPLKNLRFTRLSYTKNLAKNKTARMYMTTDTSLVRPVRSLS